MRLFVLAIRLVKAFKLRVLLKLLVSLTMKTILETKGNGLYTSNPLTQLYKLSF